MFERNTVLPMSRSLRVLAALLAYPDARMRQHLSEMSELLRDERAVSISRRQEIDALIDRLRCIDPLQAEAEYVELFDSSRATSLHLFEHVHGDSRERGPALIDLGQTYEKAGLILADGELPDFLPAVLEFVSTQPPREARAFLGEMSHIFNAIFSALQKQRSGYASVLGALIELAGEKAHAVEPAPDVPLDESWAEPPVFDGCSSKGQAKPGQAQPIHIVRRKGHRGVRPQREHRLMNGVYGFLFQVYPYVCFTVFLMGSLIRFDQNQYTWKSDSSQMLRAGMLRWGSNLFHFGILFLFFGHMVGLFTPHAVYSIFMSAGTKQMLAVVAGGIAGAFCFVGLSMLLYRRVFDPRIRLTSHRTDIAILVILWVQLVVGLITLPFSWQHADGSAMVILADWAQRIVTLRPVDATVLAALPWPYLVSHRVRHDDLSAVSVQPPGPRVEWLCHPCLPVSSAPGGAQPAAECTGR